ncbi:RHS repeat-associated core domain-containing protein [Pseudomonas asiatica]|uniref:RHS repeat-associated core domain-containing protein n=1 Tax=Pseudomonas asiatica TaxID=2219225 RepID=UPI00383A73C5
MAAAKNTRRFYQNNHVRTELDGSVTRSIFRHQNSLLALCTSGAEESRSIMAVDNSNTVMSELRDSGKAQFAYTPYGHRTVQGESNNPLAFNGEILDTPTDCYLLGSYRLASPGSYRFYSDDDQSPFGKGGLNSKAYCAGDPVNNVDPTGHFPLANILNIAMMITGGVSVGTAIAGALVKDPKSRNILNITSIVLGTAAALLMSGAYVKSQFKLSKLQTKKQDLGKKVNSLQQTVSDQQGTIARQERIIRELNAASSNSQMVRITPPNSAQQRSLSSASSDPLDMRGFRQHT